MQTFEDFGLPAGLNKSLKSIGFEQPTAIQKKAIPLLLERKDLLACAETGSGKTGAYLIPLVKHLMENPKESGLILAPTRELAQQISQFLKSLTHNNNNFYTATLIGGQDIRKQFRALQRKPRIIVATPGRLTDHLNRNTAQIHKMNHLVLDEGDRMLDMGFEPQIKEILKLLPKERQTSLFTATLDQRVKALSKKYLSSPETLSLNTPRPVSKIRQSVVKVESDDKNECLLDELNSREGSVVVFLKTRRATDKVKKYLTEYGVSVDLIHGGRTQGQRNRALKDFKDGKTRVLCATDVAARGIDVPQVEHVINFDLPMQDEDYVHRVGRTARNGAEGEAITLVTPSEHNTWNKLVKKYEIPNAMLEPNQVKRSAKKAAGNRSRGPKKKAGPRRKASGQSKTGRKSASGSAGGKKKTSRKKSASSSVGSKKRSTQKKASSGGRPGKKKKAFRSGGGVGGNRPLKRKKSSRR
ncbi:MAG: DEAD/DEAH box helicase [Bdellovibrionales bacterium]|nr:DEAD/DEAH box helicase [Bdellovibrionales bacterium]